MAASEVSICNLAIGWLGGSLITSLSDQSIEAKLCNANYEPLRDAVLEAREWTFAVRREQLARVAVNPVYGFGAAFQIPVDVLRVLQVSAGTSISQSSTGIGQENAINWVREGDKVLCNEDPVFARTLVQVIDPQKFSEAFRQALAARIAMDLAVPLTNSRQLQADLSSLYGAKLRDAATTDGMQGRAQTPRSDALIQVR